MPESSIDFEKPIPLFPLSSCVLLPHATVPLHIFEERYRAMTRDVLDSNGLIAMAVFDGEGYKSDYEGNPPIRPHVCVGYIVRHQRLDDGRYNILLQGLARAKIVEEHDHTPYRVAMLEPIEGPRVMEIDFDESRARIEGLINDPLLLALQPVEAVRNWLDKEIPTVALTDLAILTVCSDSDLRYAMLAEPDARLRADWLIQHLAETRRTLELAKKLGNSRSESGLELN